MNGNTTSTNYKKWFLQISTSLYSRLIKFTPLIYLINKTLFLITLLTYLLKEGKYPLASTIGLIHAQESK